MTPEQLADTLAMVHDRLSTAVQDFFRAKYQVWTLEVIESAVQKFVDRVLTKPVLMTVVRPRGESCHDDVCWSQTKGDGTALWEETCMTLLTKHGRMTYLLPESF